MLYGKNGLFLPSALTLLGALTIWRHKSNIQRLLNGTEHRFGRAKKSDAPVHQEASR
jgi:glycerol-3-phosphate acyltransferase PlsY